MKSNNFFYSSALPLSLSLSRRLRNFFYRPQNIARTHTLTSMHKKKENFYTNKTQKTLTSVFTSSSSPCEQKFSILFLFTENSCLLFIMCCCYCLLLECFVCMNWICERVCLWNQQNYRILWRMEVMCGGLKAHSKSYF